MRQLLLLALFFAIVILIGRVSADPDWCAPMLGTTIIVDHSGDWFNITINGDCPICVLTEVGLECVPCPFVTAPRRALTEDDDDDIGDIYRGRSFPFQRDLQNLLLYPLFR